MSNGTVNPLDSLPHMDVVIKFYPSANVVNIVVPGELQGFIVMGLLEQAKAIYWDNFRAMQKDQRIVPATAVPKLSA